MASLALPPVLDLKATAPLLQDLLAARGQDLTIEAAEVQRLGGQCLQILLAATESWRADGNALRVQNPSEAFAATARLLGAADLLGDRV